MALQQTIEFEPRNASPNCSDGWRRFVAVEQDSGARHILTTWAPSSRGAAQMIAKAHASDFLKLAPGTYA